MRKIIALTTASTFAAVASPALASSSKPTLCEKAYGVRAAVVHKYGKRAPGRNICRYGVKHSTGTVVPATADQKVRYLTQLRKLDQPNVIAVPPPQPPAGTATAASVPGNLSAIAQCESGGNPQAVDPSGTYRGLYQFDQRTWQSVGGSGDPAAASPAEQTKRAMILMAQRGSSPWPICGR